MTATSEVLLQNELFRGVTPDELRHLGFAARDLKFPLNHVLFSQGGFADRLYLVTDGILSLRKQLMAPVPIPDGESSITLCGPGEAAGWSALVHPFRYTLTAVAVTAVSAIAVEGWDLRSGMERNPRIGYKVMSSLAEVVSRRLRQIEDALMAYRAYALMSTGEGHGQR